MTWFADEQALLERIAAALVQRRECMGVAESCTGGLIGAACTSLSGSSQWFERGVISYSDQSKVDLLGVPAALIAAHGAVSGEVAEQMALGLLSRAPLAWALAVTGIAGPAGGSKAKPVGTVWLALAQAGHPAKVWREHFSGDRNAVRLQTLHSGLNALHDGLSVAAHAPPFHRRA